MGKTGRKTTIPRPRKFYVTWLCKGTGKIETKSFSTLYEAKRFAGNQDTAGLNITSA